MIAKHFEIENAILEKFTANSSFKYKKAHFKGPLDLESQVQILLYEEQKIEVDDSITHEQRRQLVKMQLLKTGYTREIVDALLFKNKKWQEITSID